MGSQSSMSMASSTMSGMAMGSSTTASMSMDMGSHSSMSMASSTMSGMAMGSSTADSMSMDMGMNSYLTTDYSGYPVVFKTLTAANGGAAFGIFCILFFTAFAFKGLGFLSAYLEQAVFRDPKKFDLSENDSTIHQHHHVETHNHKDDIQESSRSSDTESDLTKKKHFEKNRSVIARFFSVTPTSLYRDFIRVILAFVSAMLGYALMLAAMSFIIPFFFAVILGLSFGEVFFHRLASVMEINTNNSICGSLH